MSDSADSQTSQELRQRATQTLEDGQTASVDPLPETAVSLIHELRVHQIELELQNEALRVTLLELDTSRRRYMELYESSPVGLLTLSGDERIVETNLTFATLVGMDRDALISRSLFDFIDHEGQDTYHFFYQKLSRTRQAQVCELPLLPTSLKPLVVRMEGMVSVQPDDQTLYRIAVSDVSARHRAEMELTHLHAAEHEARIEAERAVLRLSSLQQITAVLSGASTCEQVTEIFLQQSTGAVNANSSTIMLLSEDGSNLEMLGSHNSATDDETDDVLPDLLTLDAAMPLAEATRQQQSIWLQSRTDYARCYPEAFRALADDQQAFACLPLTVNGRTIGGLQYSFAQMQTFSEEDRTFIEALAQQCAIALERVRLSEQVQELAILEERQRLARELHDAVTQTLFAATTLAETLPLMWERQPQRAREHLTQVVTLNRAAMAEMRTLLHELRPTSIMNTHFSTLLRELSDAVRGRREIEVVFESEGEEQPLPADVHLAVYRIAQETMNNVIKHSQATALTVQLASSHDQLTLTIRDNGRGFDAAQSPEGIGMGTMRERARAIHAQLEITSIVGVGTTMQLVWG